MAVCAFFPPVEFHTCDEEKSYVEDVMRWHDEILEEDGFRGLRDKTADGTVNAAVDATFMSHFGQTPAHRFKDFFEQMAFFAEHLSCDHPFGDGNKRTTVKQLFAYMHSCGIGLNMLDSEDPEKNELYMLITNLVNRRITYKEVGDCLREKAYDLRSTGRR